MRRTALLIVFICATIIAFAQKKVLVQGTYPILFIQHKVISGETLYSISKLYNLTVEQVAKQNGLDGSAVLAIDKVMKISLDGKNFTQDGQSTEAEALVPLHHIVKAGDNLFRISQTYGKVRIDFLREWNDLNNDVIQQGQNIIIGHLKVDKKKTAEVITRTTTEEEEKNSQGYGSSEPAKPTTTQTNTTNEPTPIAVTNGDDDEGVFAGTFTAKGKDVTRVGDCATFKTTSGWTDRKYYVLINDIAPGTIVRITADNNKSVCAKVLGPLPVMKENNNLLLRLSNAAASVLRITDAKFTVRLTYFD
jgi:LysM repeat protein